MSIFEFSIPIRYGGCRFREILTIYGKKVWNKIGIILPVCIHFYSDSQSDDGYQQSRSQVPQEQTMFTNLLTEIQEVLSTSVSSFSPAT